MAVPYQELADSPTFYMDRKGGGATRRAVIDWDDIEEFFVEVFPSPYNGYATARFPLATHLVVDSVSVSPFNNDPLGDCGPINKFPNGALVVVDYRVPEMDFGMQAGPRGDLSGPGGAEGSTGDQKGQDQTFVTHSLNIGGEIITFPHNAWRWQFSANGQANAQEEQYAVTGDVVIGKMQILVEHDIEWHQVQWPPWQAVKACVGRVNAYKFAGAPRGTLLFLGASAQRELTNSGTTAWTLGYKFSEKNYNPANPTRPRGWNYFLRPDGIRAGQFELLWKDIPVVEYLGRKTTPHAFLTGGINQGNVTLGLDARHVTFPAEGQFRVVVGDNPGPFEYMEVTRKVGATLTVLRNVNGGKRRDFGGGVRVAMAGGLAYDSADFRKLFVPGVRLA